MKILRIKCPAKINLTLEIVNKREDGFHNIKSIMQTVNLFDYLNIKVYNSPKSEIKLTGTSREIPYNEKNLVYKAAALFLKEAKIKNTTVEIHIEKNIPIAAGLAGGSSDAAGTLFGLNKIFSECLDKSDIERLCAMLGSDLNVCLNGGCVLAASRGEVTQKLKDIESELTIIKPKNLGISAGEAYRKYAAKTVKPQNNMTEKMIAAIDENKPFCQYLYNDLEYAVFDDYKELQTIKQAYPNSVMSGSGSAYFVLENLPASALDENYQFINNLKFINHGTTIAGVNVLGLSAKTTSLLTFTHKCKFL